MTGTQSQGFAESAVTGRTKMVSVVLCTYNRAAKLIETLPLFANVEAPPSAQWELVVVDNNSTDSTKQVIESVTASTGLPIRYVFAGKQGLGAARNVGLRAARGDIIAFTDDDCIVDTFWLAEIAREFAMDPLLGGLGGRVELFNQNDRPVTIRTSRERHVLSEPGHAFTSIVGCNMVFRRELFDAIGDFDPGLGAGTPLPSEDLDFIYRALRGGQKLVYCPNVLVYHDHGRNTDALVRALETGYIVGRGGVYAKHIWQGDKVMRKMAYWEVRPLLTRLMWSAIRLRSAWTDAHRLASLARGAMRGLKLARKP